MKKTLLSLTLTSVLASTAMVSTTASAEVTANVAVTSNYLWRGLEQAGNASAVSGGIDYADDSGFYAGTWTSNVGSGTELDLYGGFGGDISETVSYDVGYVYFAYPDIDDSDFSEIYGSISTGGLTFGLAVLATAEDYDFADSIYANVDYGFALASGAEVALHLGSYTGDFSSDAIDVGASISKDGFTFGVSKIDLDDGANSDAAKFYVSYAVDFEL